jgi:hypothetical protein
MMQYAQVASMDTYLIQLGNSVMLNVAILKFGVGKRTLALTALQDSI